MTWANFQRTLFYKAKEEANEWDRLRVLLSYVLNTSVSRKIDQKKPSDILPLWIDKLRKKKTITKERMEAILEAIRRNEDRI